MTQYRLGNISKGYAAVYREGSGTPVATLNQVEYEASGTVGSWFAVYYPALYAHEWDMASRAIAWGDTRKECLENFKEFAQYGWKGRPE